MDKALLKVKKTETKNRPIQLAEKASSFLESIDTHILLKMNDTPFNWHTGHNRISQIAAFSGYPKNKCDKYIKALDAAGFIEQRTQRDHAGTLRTHYYPKGGYYRTWYELYFPCQNHFDKLLIGEAVSELLNRIDQISTIPYFKRVCMRYIRSYTGMICLCLIIRPITIPS